MPTVSVNPTPTDQADFFTNYASPTGNPTTQSASTHNIGSVQKSLQNQATWFIFEPDIPLGAELTSVSFRIHVNTKTGTAAHTVSVGFLELDGTWNVQASDLGWGEYGTSAASLPYPNRTGAADAGWEGGSARFFTNFLNGVVTSGDWLEWNDAGSGTGDVVTTDSGFLTDAQNIFNDNETNRTARGVPMAILAVPSASAGQMWNINSAEAASLNPILEISYEVPEAELDGDATIDAAPSLGANASAELSGDATLDAEGELTFEADSELSADATLDAAPSLAISVDSELSADATLDAESEILVSGAIELSADATVDAAPSLAISVDSELAADATLDATPSLAGELTSELSADATVDAEGELTFEADSELSADATLDAAPQLELAGASEMDAAAALDADGVLTLLGATELTADALLDATGSLILDLASELGGTATIFAEPRGNAIADGLALFIVTAVTANATVTATTPNVTVTAAAAEASVTAGAASATVTAGSATITVTDKANTAEVRS